VLAQCRITEALRLDDRGVTAVEYALIAGLIAVVIAGAVALLGTTVLGLFNSAANAI
jgi:pilus assembly protein Flp/PilA